jgi:hypothetical protein
MGIESALSKGRSKDGNNRFGGGVIVVSWVCVSQKRVRPGRSLGVTVFVVLDAEAIDGFGRSISVMAPVSSFGIAAAGRSPFVPI